MINAILVVIQLYKILQSTVTHMTVWKEINKTMGKMKEDAHPRVAEPVPNKCQEANVLHAGLPFVNVSSYLLLYWYS